MKEKNKPKTFTSNLKGLSVLEFLKVFYKTKAGEERSLVLIGREGNLQNVSQI